MDKSVKIRKGVESQTIYVGIEAGAEAGKKKPIEKGVIRIGKKIYRTPLPSTCKETELSEELNNGMGWVFRDYVRSLKQSKYHLTTR